jgi:peptidoglycan biosynthesis protein MviN/MurJ (putative lipid II flippase)
MPIAAGGKMTLSAFVITVFNLTARGFQLIFFILIGNHFGVDGQTDMVLFLQAPLLVLMAVSTSAAEAVVIPAVHRGLALNCPGVIMRSLYRKALPVVSIMAVLILGGILLTVPRASLMVAVLLFPMPALGVVSAVSMGSLNAVGHYRRATLGPIAGALLAIPTLLLIPRSEHSLAFSLLMFECGRALWLRLQAGRAVKEGDAGMPDSGAIIRWAVRGAKLQALASLIAALNPMVDILFANGLSQGAVTLVEYANRLWNCVPLLLSGTIVIAYTGMSQAASRGQLDPARVRRVAIRVGLAAGILSLMAIGILSPVIDLLYGYGRMDAGTRGMLVNLLMWYLVGSGPFSCGLVFVRGLSAEGRIDVITMVAAISLFVNVSGNYLFIQFFGLSGIGMATSLTLTVNTLLLAIHFRSDARRPAAPNEN